MPFYDKITLNSGQSLIIPHCPEKLSLEKVGAKAELEKKATEQFGLFDTAQPNFHTYYPDVTAEDLKPKDGEFIRPIFRAISETIVHRKTNPIDFSKNGILKASMAKLLGQTVYANHEASVGNEIGSVAKVAWQNGYETSMQGYEVPAGINAEFLIDGKAHPNIARGILMDPPSVHSNSVTVSFGWEKSHPKMSDEEFRSKIGTFGDDKELVRRIVTEIPMYHETSLVAHGADPFAQLLKDGKFINNPSYAAAVEKMSAKTGTQVYFFNYKTDTLSLRAGEENNPPETQTINNTMKEYLLTLAIILACNDTNFASLSEADQQKLIDEKLKAAKADADKVIGLTATQTTLQAEKDRLTTELATSAASVTSLTAEVATLKPMATIGEKFITDQRKDVLRMYKVLHGEENTGMLAMLAKADATQLEAFQTEYQKLMDEKYPGHCTDCNSNNITRNSAIIEVPKPGAPGTGNPTKQLSDEEVRNSFSSTHNTTSKLSGLAELPKEEK